MSKKDEKEGGEKGREKERRRRNKIQLPATKWVAD